MTEEECDRILEAIGSGDFASMFQAVRGDEGDLTPDQRRSFLQMRGLPRRESFDPEIVAVLMDYHLICSHWNEEIEYLMLTPTGTEFIVFVEVFERKNGHCSNPTIE